MTPTRSAGLDRMAAFAPRMGRAYAAGRNADPGPDGEYAVSALSPYVRHRLLLEQELVQAALDAHGPRNAEKFIQEVFWRAYWKGWLEGRPSIWAGYRASVARDHDRLATEAGLRRAYHDATEGRTGIDCFDSWARELVGRNWLHNHSRMWFASIWIFTLRLPWALGADFFMRHLLDGDPASNTLSWRWVAGLHTPGKNYLARAENIRRYTDGRFDPRGQLDEHAAPLTESGPLPAPASPSTDPRPMGDILLLLHEDDLAPETLPLDGMTVRGIAAVPSSGKQAHRGVGRRPHGRHAIRALRAGGGGHCRARRETGSQAMGRACLAARPPRVLSAQGSHPANAGRFGIVAKLKRGLHFRQPAAESLHSNEGNHMSKLSGSRLSLSTIAMLAGAALIGARAAQPTSEQIAAFCAEPKGMEIYPAPAEAERPVEPGLPAKAQRAHKSGCAGIKFHIGKDGLVHDATVVAEHPQGFGFAKSTLEALDNTNYGAKQAADHWYYINSVFSIEDSEGSARPDVE